MNAVLYHANPANPISGNIFYLFEYYLIIRKYKEIKFIILDTNNLNYIKDIFLDKYEFDKEILDDIISWNSKEILKLNIDKCLTTDRVYNDLTLIRAKEIFIFNTWNSFENKIKKNDKRVKIFNECEMCGDVNYFRKLYFKAFKKPSNVENNIFVHLPNVRIPSEEEFTKIYESFNNYEQILIYTDREIEYLNKFEDIKVYNEHIFNFFNRFNRYAYVLPNGQDYSPRLLLEAKYLNKEILYYRNIIENDGGFKRYNDILSDNILKYELNENDDIINMFK